MYASSLVLAIGEIYILLAKLAFSYFRMIHTLNSICFPLKMHPLDYNYCVAYYYILMCDSILDLGGRGLSLSSHLDGAERRPKCDFYKTTISSGGI